MAGKGVSYVVAGLVHTDFDLLFCDLDRHALYRHAVEKLLVLGHHAVGLVIAEPYLGNQESEVGFLGAKKWSANETIKAVVACHDGTLVSIARVVRRISSNRSMLKVLLVDNVYHYLAVSGFLTQYGKKVLQDKLFILRDKDPFLAFCCCGPL